MEEDFGAPTPQEPDSGNPPPIPDQPQPTPSEPDQPQEISQDSKNLAMLCHLLGLLTNFLGPLILWLVKKDDDAFIDEQGKEALNFQITLMLAGIVAGATSCIGIGLILLPVVVILDLVFSIMACVAASKGQHYRYPVSMRLVK
jgi:hypothetical protein